MSCGYSSIGATKVYNVGRASVLPKLQKALVGICALHAGFVAPYSYAQLEEVIVTAEFREKSVMETAMSLSAFDNKLLDKFRMNRSMDIAAQTPNLEMQVAPFGASSPRISMRGISNADFGPTSSNPVTVYSDGVVINNSTAQGFTMFDLERVEVLRGPQGTLYGRNSTTGSINFLSARPTEEFSGYAELTVGRYGEQRVRGAVSGAVSDRVRGRIALNVGRDDGWITNVADGTTGPDSEDIAIRGVLEIDFGESVSTFLKVQHSEVDGSSVNHHNIFASNPVTGFVHVGPTADFRKIELDLVQRPLEIESNDAAFRLDWSLGEVVFTSITGYHENERIYVNDADQSTIPFLHEAWDHEQQQFSQEFRLASETESKLSWIAGVYYIQDSIEAETRFDFSGFLQGITGAPSSVGFGFGQDMDLDLESFAGFVQLDLEISEQWSVGVGLRYTEDEKEIGYFGRSCYTFPRLNNQTFVDWSNAIDCGLSGRIVDAETWSDVTGGLSLQYRPNPSTMFYGNLSRGFKGGDYNLNTAFIQRVDSVDPESLLSYELGLKWESDSQTVTVSAAAFWYDYEDLQQFSLEENLETLLINVPEAEVKGLELEVNYAPIEGFRALFGVGYTDTEFTDFVQGDGTDLTGNAFPHAPELTFNGLIQYAFRLSQEWSLTPQLDWTWTDEYFGDIYNTQSVVINDVSYALPAPDDWDVNIRMTLTAESSGLEVTAFVEDLGEDAGDYISSEGVSGLPFGTTWARFAKPETYGVRLTYPF